MISLRFTRHLFLMLASMSVLLFGACHDDGLIDPPTNEDECCAQIVVSVNSARTDSSAAVPLGGVSVALRKGATVVATKETNAEGIATFNDVCNADYNVRLTKNGYAVAERGEIKIDTCVVKNVSIIMSAVRETGGSDSCCSSTLRIIPTDAAGATVAGAEVRIAGPNGVVRTQQSTHEGATFRELCRGEYSIRIAREGFKVNESSVSLACNVEITERRMLMRNQEPVDTCCNARLVVAATSGNVLLNGATVKLWKSGALVRTLVINGRPVVFEDLCEGGYGISVSKEGYKPVEGDVHVRCNAVLEKSFELQRIENNECCDNQATLLVFAERPRMPIANATVRLFKGGALKATLKTNYDGAVRFNELCEGEYVASVEREGYRPAEVRLNVRCQQTLRDTVVLVSHGGGSDTCCTAAYRLKVSGSERNALFPLNNAHVVIKRNGVVIADGVTNREGLYARENLCGKSRYTVVIEHDAYQRKEFELNIDVCRLYENEVHMTRR